MVRYKLAAGARNRQGLTKGDARAASCLAPPSFALAPHVLAAFLGKGWETRQQLEVRAWEGRKQSSLCPPCMVGFCSKPISTDHYI